MKNQRNIEGFQGMDLDSSDATIEASKGMYREAYNMRIYPKGILTSMDGMSEIGWDAPSGQNECIGEYWDSESDSTFLMFWNSNGDHSIIRVFADDLSAHTLIVWDGLNFSRDSVISGRDFIFQQLFAWVDSGRNDPRQIDVIRADDTDKKLVVRVYFPTDPNVVDSRGFGGRITNPSGTVVAGPLSFYLATAAEVFSYQKMITGWCAAFNGVFGAYATAASCGSYAEVTFLNAGAWSLRMEYTDTIGGTPNAAVDMVIEYRNTYMKPWDRTQLDLAVFNPLNPPEVSVITDPVRSDNRIERKVFQFALRYVFRSNGRSIEGPWSEIVAVSPSVYGAASTGNAIVIDFSNDQNLLTPQAFAEVEQIEVFVKELNGLWKSATILDKWEFAYNRSWTFRNDTQLIAYQGVSNGTEEPFPLNPSSFVPQRAWAQTLIADPNNQENIRLMQGGIEEGLPAPCIPVDLDIEYEPGSDIGQVTCSVRVRVKIVNPLYDLSIGASSVDQSSVDNQAIHCLNPSETDAAKKYVFGGMMVNIPPVLGDYRDPADVNQFIPLGGFVVYLAGTNNYAVTQQVFEITAAPGTPAYNDAVQALNSLTYIQGTTIPETNTSGKRIALRKVMSEYINIYQEAVITGVKPDQSYLVRFAEHRCNVLNDGTILDISGTSLQWQKTSTQVISVGIGSSMPSAVSIGDYEARIDIPSGFTGQFDAGIAAVADCAGVNYLGSNRVLIREYLFDYDGVGTAPGADIRDFGTPAEKQRCILNDPPPNGSAADGVDHIASLGFAHVRNIARGESYSDHNGHVFFWGVGTSGANDKKTQWLTNTGQSPTPVFPVGTAVGNYRIANDYDSGGMIGSSKYIGNLSGALGATTINQLTFTNNIAEYIIPNLIPTADGPTNSMRTRVEGSVVDSATQSPLSGIVVAIENGKWTRTDVNGLFSIPVYADCWNYSNSRLTDGLVVFAPGYSSIQWVQPFGYYQSTFIQITPIDPDPNVGYSDSYPYQFDADSTTAGQQPIPAIVPTSATLGAVWPRGWRGAFGVVLYDQHARPTPVQKLKEVYIPWQTEDLNKINPIAYPVPQTYYYGLPSISFDMLGDVPIPKNGRYVRYQFVATRNNLYRFMLQWAVPFVLYISEYDEGNGPVPTSPTSGSATEILLYMTPSFQRYRELYADTADYVDGSFVQASQVGYEWQVGDRLIILTNSQLAYLPLIDVAIVGQRGDAIVIKADSNIPTMNGGEIVVIYRPSVEDQEESGREYFEIPGASFEIIDPFGTPQWSSVAGILPGGDSYIIGAQIPIRPGFNPLAAPPPPTPWTMINVNRFSTSVSDFYQSNVASLGRNHFEDSLAKTELISTRFRWSDPWVKGSSLNGLFTWNALDFRDANPRHGLIRSMVFMSDVVVCLCEGSVSFSVYIGSVTSRSMDGVLTAATSGVVGQVRDFAVEYGTVNPESVKKYKTWLFAFDYNHGVGFRYSVNGFDSFTIYGIDQFIREETRDFDGKPLPRVPIGINEKFDEVWFSMSGGTTVDSGIDIEIGNFTYTFHDGSNKWISKVDAVPEMYSRTRTKMLSIKAGRIYVNDSDPSMPCNFFNTQFNYGAKFVENSEPISEKVWQAAAVAGSPGYRFTEFDAGNGQVSASLAVKRINGADHAARGILPDSSGNKLRSKALTVTVLNNTGDPGNIHAVSTRWSAVHPKP